MRLLSPQVLRNAAALYGVHVVTYALPLLTTPFLARTLGPGAWGALAVAQAFALLVALLIEFGFDLSGTREAARRQEDRASLGALLSSVTVAKGLLTVTAALLTLAAQQWVPAFRQEPLLLWVAFAWAAAQALNVMWFFQGIENLARVSTLDIGLKAAGTAAVFLTVRGPADAWLVPAAQGAAALASAGLCLWLAARHAPLTWPGWAAVNGAVRLGTNMFVFRAASSVYASSAAFLLGLFVSPQLVGYYAGADRIARAFQGLLSPLHRALFPRYARMVHLPPAQAREALASGMRLMAGAGLLLSLCAVFGAPLLVQVLLGPAFGESVPLLRVLGLLPAVIAVNIVLGLFWLLPRGMDLTFNLTVLGAAALNAGLIVWLVPRGGPLAMAGAVVVTELAVLAVLTVAYALTRRGPVPAETLGRSA